MCNIKDNSNLNINSNSRIIKKFKIEDPIFNFNINFIEKNLLNNNVYNLFEICKCRFFHKNCFLIFFIYSGSLKCENCLEFYEIKATNFLKMKDKFQLE